MTRNQEKRNWKSGFNIYNFLSKTEEIYYHEKKKTLVKLTTATTKFENRFSD